MLKFNTDAVIFVRVKTRFAYNTPLQAHDGEWFDLSAAVDTTLKAGDAAALDLGVCIEIPKGFEAIVAPRSSTFKNYGIIQTNGIGVIDNAYCGDEDWWKMPVYATRDITIPAGARIAQFRIQKQQPRIETIGVLRMGNENRGGLGSTGK